MNGLIHKLNQVETKYLGNYLINEHPQVIAVVLSLLESDKVEQVLKLFPSELSNECVRRSKTLEAVSSQVIFCIIKEITKESYLASKDLYIIKGKGN